MKKILILGAGLSTISLIDYLLRNAEENNWQITLGDIDEEMAKKKVNGSDYGTAISFDINDEEFAKNSIKNHDVVISMLPAFMHMKVVEKCIEFKKPMLTASYATPEIKAMHQQAQDAGIPIIMELGVDPGIDHMSAMHVINRIRKEGGDLQSFYK